MFLGCYDARARSLTYSNAGHLPPLVIERDGSVQPAGNLRHRSGPVRRHELRRKHRAMQPGDIFVAYSDGVTEPENEFGEFGEERLIELIQRIAISRWRASARS